MKKKNKILIGIFSVIICLCASLLIFSKEKAVAETLSTEQQLKQFTSSDAFYDGTENVTLEQFVTKYNNGAYLVESGSLQLTSVIQNILPAEWLTTAGTYVYVGDENALVAYTYESGVYHVCTFLIVDFDFRYDKTNEGEEMSKRPIYRVEPVFQTMVKTQVVENVLKVENASGEVGINIHLKNLAVSVDVQNENHYNYEKENVNPADSAYYKKQDTGPSIYIMDYDGYAYESLVNLEALSEFLCDTVLTYGLDLLSVSQNAFVSNVAKGTRGLLKFKENATAFANALETYRYGVEINQDNNDSSIYKTVERQTQYNGEEYESFSRNLKVGIESLGMGGAYFIDAPQVGNKNSFFEITVELDEDTLNDIEQELQYTSNARLTFSSAFNVMVSSGGVDSYITQDVNGNYCLTDSIYFEGVEDLTTTNRVLNVAQTIEEKRFDVLNAKHIQEKYNVRTENTYDITPGYILDDNGYKLYKFTPPHVGADYTFYAEQNGTVAPYLDMFLLPSTADLNAAIDAGYWDLREMCLAYSDTATNGLNSLTYNFANAGTYYVLYKPSESYAIGKRLFAASYKFLPQPLALGDNTISFLGGTQRYFKIDLGDGYDYTVSCTGATFTLYNSDMTVNTTAQNSISFYKTSDACLLLSLSDAVDTATVTMIRERTIYYVTGTSESLNPTWYVNQCGSLQTPTVAPSGYEFVGWWDNENYNGEQITTANIDDNNVNSTLYAKWTPIVYTVTYVENGGLNVADVTYTVEDTVMLHDEVLKDGYEFAGWYDNEALSGSAITGWSAGTTGNKTLYAKYTQPTSYTVTYYNTEGTTASGTYTYTYNRASFTKALPTLSKVDYDFMGWYDNASFTGDPITSIPTGSEGDKAFYAKFVANYDIRLIYEYPDPLTSLPTQTIEVYGEAAYVLYLPTYENENFRLVSWHDYGGNYYTPGSQITVYGSTTLYAAWETRVYVITYANLYYGSQKASVINGIMSYTYGNFPSLSGVTASFSADPYSPQFRFLGWYTDMTFQRPYNTIEYLYGDVQVFAKWRYDFAGGVRTSEYTITDSGVASNPSDNIIIALDVSTCNNLVAMGITRISVKVYVNMKEVNDGYQEIYVTTNTGVTLWSNGAIEHGGSVKNTEYDVLSIPLDYALSELQGVSIIYIQYNAHGSGDDDWKNQLYYEVMFYRDAADKSAMDFYWKHEYPFAAGTY